jgi:acyl-CoA thioesterase-1
MRLPALRFIFVFTLVSTLFTSALPSSTLVCLGDSITAGYGLEEAQAYPALLLQKLPGWSIVNAGVSGDTTAGGLKRLDWILRSKPDAVFVALGGNDGLRGIKASETESNLLAILAKVKASGAKAFLAGMMVPTNYGPDYFFDFKVLYPRVAQKAGVQLYPFLLQGVGGKPELNQADGIHPTAQGQEILAKRIAAFLAARLPKASASPKKAAAKVIRSRKDLP